MKKKPRHSPNWNYAINIADMTRPELRIPIMCAVMPVTSNRQIVQIDASGLDEGAVLLECGDEQAVAICEILSRAARDTNQVCRCYKKGPRGGWAEIPRPAKGWRR